MNDSRGLRGLVAGPAKSQRKRLSLSTESLVNEEWYETGKTKLLMITPSVGGIDLRTWASINRAYLETRLLTSGALLLRNFEINGVAEFEQFLLHVSDNLLDYQYRSTPRKQLQGKIYSSTEYPANQSILLHNENSYCRKWPLKLWFFCNRPAERGGETPIADSRRIFSQIPLEIRERFIEKGVLYVRNLGNRLDLPWQEVFQTADRSEAEEHCRDAGIEYEWIAKDHLKLRQICQAVASHPVTNEEVWFNQAHLFHKSALPRELSDCLSTDYQDEDLPRNAYYGDGSTIESSVLDEIRGIYEREALVFPWRTGDILMLDNMLMAHGRAPFTGAREIAVGFAEIVAGESLFNQRGNGHV